MLFPRSFLEKKLCLNCDLTAEENGDLKGKKLVLGEAEESYEHVRD